jgi:hypothetical protein
MQSRPSARFLRCVYAANLPALQLQPLRSAAPSRVGQHRRARARRGGAARGHAARGLRAELLDHQLSLEKVVADLYGVKDAACPISTG